MSPLLDPAYGAAEFEIRLFLRDVIDLRERPRAGLRERLREGWQSRLHAHRVHARRVFDRMRLESSGSHT